MDTITHGIAGALISKGAFGGSDLFPIRKMERARITTWVLMLGSVFPDSDVLRDMFSHNELLMITWHRSLTHSLVLLPIWAALLAGLTRGIARWRKWDAPSFANLMLIWGVGILSHIFLDLVTTFGTMIWSPLGWQRPAWDLVFIVDFTLTAILLLPQLLAWAYEDGTRHRKRVLAIWLVFLPAPLLIAKIAQIVGAPIKDSAILAAMILFTLLFLVPVYRGWGHKIGYANWNRGGLLATAIYLVLVVVAHRTALTRMQEFAREQQIEVEAIGALPLPPSLWHWDGLIRGPRGVYEVRMDLSDSVLHPADGETGNPEKVIESSYYPDAFPNRYIELARQLPEVQKVLWFTRFPVTRFHKEGGEAVVEFSDLRFPQIRPDRPAAFTYRVRFSPDGAVMSKGWVKN